MIETQENLGFSAACNRGAAAASGELLCLLNPDAVPQPGWRAAIVAPRSGGRGWAAWQALVTAEDGAVINTSGGIVHFTGIAWAGQAGRPATAVAPPEEPGFVSGACLVLTRRAFADAGALPEDFFLYHEDVDLSLRVRLAGGTLGVATAARVDHDYDFDKGPEKWRYLERNRWATLIRTYPLALLLVLAPALLATELALLVVASSGGWLSQKLRAAWDVIGWMPRLLRERREVQAGRAVSAREFAAGLTPRLDSPFLGAAGRSRLLGWALGAYWRFALAVLGAGRG